MRANIIIQEMREHGNVWDETPRVYTRRSRFWW
jgi:hypothetical protein